MSIWTRISDAISALAAGEGLTAVFEKLRTSPDKTVAFTISVIALGAKMAKADGHVTRDEVTAFREVFSIPKSEEKNAAHLFNMARTDVAGYEEYAHKIKAMFGNDKQDVLCDLMEGLFHIALADGVYHPNENAFLEDVATILGFDARRFSQIRAQFVEDADRDPYDILGVDPQSPFDVIKAAYRSLVRETHPDRMQARGVPEEAIKLAEKRLIAINRAWDEIEAQHAA